MALPQDILSRIINVKWAAGGILVCTVSGRVMSSGTTNVTVDPRITMSCAALGWSNVEIDGVIGDTVRSDGRKILFDKTPRFSESYANTSDSASKVESTPGGKVMTRGLYNLYNYQTGVVVTSIITAGGGIQVPYAIDFANDPSPGTGYDAVYRVPQDFSDENAVAIAVAAANGYGGFNWAANLVSVLREVDSPTQNYYTNVRSVCRLFFVNPGALRAANPDLKKLRFDFRIFWSASKKQIYMFEAGGMLFSKSAQVKNPVTGGPISESNVWPRVASADLLNDQWPAFVKGDMYWSPPNDDAPDPANRRGPLIRDAFASTGMGVEGGRNPASIWLELDLETDEMDADYEIET